MPRLKASRQVWVQVDGRRFRVDYDISGNAIRIIERKTLERSVSEGGNILVNTPYWHRDHHTLGAMWTVPQRVLTEAAAYAP